MKEDRFLDLMLKMARQAGEIALKNINKSQAVLKGDRSVLTKTDLAVSRLIRKNLQGLLKNVQEHILIDEEDAKSEKYFDQQFLRSVPYIWVIDPIDGTRSFANQMPTFGISIGLLKNQRPWLGVVFLPVLKELFYCDGKNAYFVQDAFTAKAKKHRIKPLSKPVDRKTVLLGNDAFLKKFDWDFDSCQMMLLSCAVIDLCWPAIGRGCGASFKANLWDLAGSWPIARKAGLELRNVQTGEVTQHVHLDLFVGKGLERWRFKDYHILSSAKNFPVIKKLMKLRTHGKTTR